MDSAWLHRARWRWRGALLWPTFVIAVAVDAAIVHARPFLGDSQSVVGGVLAGMIINLLAVVLLSGLAGLLVHRLRPDMPAAIARNYGGTAVVVLVSAGLLALGESRHAGIVARQRVLDDAIVRAEAYIGLRAPAQFRVNANRPDILTIQQGTRYRVCVPGRAGPRYYCVMVDPQLPLARSVVPAGSEPNWSLATGED